MKMDIRAISIVTGKRLPWPLRFLSIIINYIYMNVWKLCFKHFIFIKYIFIVYLLYLLLFSYYNTKIWKTYNDKINLNFFLYKYTYHTYQTSRICIKPNPGSERSFIVQSEGFSLIKVRQRSWRKEMLSLGKLRPFCKQRETWERTWQSKTCNRKMLPRTTALWQSGMM